jgi:RNA polymerase sigma-70 factor (ECF subfamily)
VALKPAPKPDPATDAELLARVAAGDLGALGDLYQRHRVDVRTFVLRATSGHGDTDDVLHNTFLTAARIADRFDGRESCRPWLIGIAARMVQQRGQKLARVARYLARLASDRSPARDPVPELDARNDLAYALGHLSAAKRVVILMAEVEGMTCAEIAEALTIPIGTVWTRLHHARRELLVALEGG